MRALGKASQDVGWDAERTAVAAQLPTIPSSNLEARAWGLQPGLTH